jgi:hypothetical protein
LSQSYPLSNFTVQIIGNSGNLGFVIETPLTTATHTTTEESTDDIIVDDINSIEVRAYIGFHFPGTQEFWYDQKK